MFTKTAAQPLFPSVIWVHDLDPKIAGPLNQRLTAELDRLVPADPSRPPGKGWQTDQSLHQRAEFQELVQIFQAASKSILEKYEIDYGGFEITGCWANISPKGGTHVSHNHPNNFLSGVYYVQAPPGGNAIDFHEPRAQVSVIRPKVKRYNLFNSIIANVSVSAGQLIIFPSWLVHSVQANQSGTLRISISFNVMFTNYIERISKPKWEGEALPEPGTAAED